MLASHALALVGVPMRRVIRIVQDQRDARYNLLRGYFHGADDDTSSEIDQERLSTVTLPLDAATLGRQVTDVALHTLGVRLVSLRRHNGKAVDLISNPSLEEGDTLVLSGRPDRLAFAEQRLLRGS
jgi:CPA2 family monovalent cation:H+ antiporter-2